MIQKLKKLYGKLFCDSDAGRMIYNFILGTLLIAILLIIVIEAVMDYEQDGLLALAALFLYLLVMFILANMYPQKVSILSSFITVPLNLFVFPFMFIVAEGGGIRSGMPVWMTMGILLIFVTAQGRWLIIQLFLTIATDTGLVLYTYMYPQMIKTVENEFYYYQDNIIAICAVALSIGIMIRYQCSVLERQNHQIERVLKETQQEKHNAQQLDKEKNKLLESLSYNVRTPLNAIAGMADMAEHHIDDPEKVRDCLNKISESSIQVLDLINHILNAAQLEPMDKFESDDLVLECTDGRFTRAEDGNLILDASGKNILIVEDNEINMEIICGILERTHAQIASAWSAEEAINLIEQSDEYEFDLILMDIQLPATDGYSAARSIRSMDREDAMEIPIIAMTADALAQDVNKAIKCGMNSCILKPIDVEELFIKLYYYMFCRHDRNEDMDNEKR